MIYVNGDSHSAGAEILQDISFAKDDPYYLTYKKESIGYNQKVIL